MASANRRALLDQLGVNDDEMSPDVEQPRVELTPPNNTGYGGGAIDIVDSQRGIPDVAEPGGFAGPAASGATATSAAPKSYGQAPSGYDQTKWNDPNSKSAKYITARNIDYNAMRQIPDEAGRKAFLAKEVQRIAPLLEAAGWKVGGVQGDKMMIGGGPDNFGMNPVDIVGDIEGAAIPSWGDDAGGGAAPAQSSNINFGGGSFGGAQLDSALSGDPLAKIQQLIAQYGGSRPNFAALMQQLGGQ